MEGITEILWELAYNLYAHESVEQKRCFAAALRGASARRCYLHSDGSNMLG